jgi:hypothetical protein
VFLLVSDNLFDLKPARRAKLVRLTQPSVALRAGQIYSYLQVLDGHHTLLEVDIINLYPQYFRDAAA